MSDMIYLIDDSDLASINAEFVFNAKYKCVLRVIRNIKQYEEERNKLCDAQCVMIHRTFDNSTITKEEIAKIAEDGEKIPMVVFSAGDSDISVFDDKNPTLISGLKKIVFYERLRDFLDEYNEKQIVNLKIIAYGKDYIKINVQTWSKIVLRSTLGKKGVISNVAQIAGPEFKKIIDAAEPAIGLSYSEILEDLEDNPCTYIEFKNRIVNIVESFNQYGKNIYSWK